jgi:hypothetical protein
VLEEKGVAAAPAVLPGTWKRKGPNGDTWHCSPHKEVLREQDDAARRERDGKVAFDSHMAKAGRPNRA